jgi:hypothetical protein
VRRSGSILHLAGLKNGFKNTDFSDATHASFAHLKIEALIGG